MNRDMFSYMQISELIRNHTIRNTLWVVFACLSFSLSIQAQDYKQAIALQKMRIDEASSCAKAELIKQLAIYYLKDQNHEKAFESFLTSLDAVCIDEPPENETQEEIDLYNQALAMYLNIHASAKEMSEQIIKQYDPLLKKYPNAWHLEYLMALAYANLELYEEFFNHFFHSYRYDPEHFFAYKTKAILHIKLMERKRYDADRNREREAALQNFERALMKEPQDATLYKLLITFSFPETKKNQALRYLNKIVEENIIISRSEIMFFVQAAVDAKDNALAQRFIDKARGWYQQSKIVTAAQHYLDSHK